ncbi:zinc finger protein 234-like isoform X5 [Culex pipiens pallens]|uniref:zinc finger protein 234-like isoform X5 n=1 Tax=Culex pipiens pallens TaxID=42434 RepID=UPI001954F54C|nr:zinc finger protein 234-like isoform X5 [Culex pipiens pallens]
MMCRQVLPDATDGGIEQIYIVKTEPGLEDDGGFANMVPETVDEIKTEPKFEENENPDDYQPDEEVGFQTVDVIVKEEPKVGSDCESNQVDKKFDVRSEKSAKDQTDTNKGKTKPKTGKKEKKPSNSTKEKVDKAQVNEKLFACSVCGKKTNNEYNLQTHLKTHKTKKKVEKEKDLTCNVCGKVSFSNYHLQIHLEGHERKAKKREQLETKKKSKLEKLQRFVCHYCPSKFTTNYNLQRHEDLHDIPLDQQIHKRKEFFCYVCDQDFGSKEGIREHLYTHADQLPYTCEECDKPISIKSVRDLNQHLEMHKDTTNGSVKCTWCPLRFHSLKGCTFHERTHVNEGSSALEELERRANILSKKKNVKIIVVEGTLRYACDHCDKSYTLLDSLRDHKTTHTDSDKPKKLHVCTICNEVFAFAGGLFTHKLVHSDLLPYKCEYCDKAFKAAIRLIEHRLKRLQKHKKNHTKVRRKPAKLHCCDMCPKKFSWLGNFRSHQKLHYNEKSRYFIPSLVEAAKPEPVVDENEDLDFGMLVKTEME